MRFYEADLTGDEIKNLQESFEKLESVIIERCTVNRKFYQQFPKLCKKLRRLYVEDFDCRRKVLRQTKDEWLLLTYPELVHLHWTQTKNWRPMNELKQFFERNPKVRSFATDIDSLWINRHLFNESAAISLDDLIIEMGQFKQYQEPKNIRYIYRFLQEIHEEGVYKRLHINLKFFSQQTINEMPPMHDLKSLCLDHTDSDHDDIILPKWLDLTELKVSSYCNLLNVDVLARQLVNLRQLHLQCVSLNDLMEFVRYSVNLTKIKVERLDDDDDEQNIIVDVTALNEEREKLKGAQKLLIFIQEEVYLQVKWTRNGKEYSLIEIRRVSSHEWNHFSIPLFKKQY